MSTTAWIMMMSTMAIVTGFTVYFFMRVLKTPDRSEEEE